MNLKKRSSIWYSLRFVASFFLMLCHVPFRNILFTAILTYKRSYSLMLSYMNFQIWSCVILFWASFKRAWEFVNILVSFFMVSENPLLSILLTTTWERACKSLNFGFLMSGEMVGKMLRHFELLITSRHCALITSNRQMTFQVLTVLWLLHEAFIAVKYRALYHFSFRYLNQSLHSVVLS